MKYSLNWLNEMISIPEYIHQPQLLVQFLNHKGLEVESVKVEQLQRVVIGQIIRQEPHSNADKLHVCYVKIHEEKDVLSIICGAQNQKPGDKVAVCLVGAQLADGLNIQERKIRGEFSQGMLASKQELGLSSQKEEGILILPSEAPIGKRLDEYLKIKDCILDLVTPPNRADLLSHIGLARELSGFLNKPMKVDYLFWPHQYKINRTQLGIQKQHLQSSHQKIYQPQIIQKRHSLEVHMHESDICPYYTGHIILNVKVGPSPLWLKKRLELLDVNSVNNIVDITSWILLEWGQPLHAFDLDTLEGNVHIRKAKPKEKMIALNDSELEFCGDELVISDDKKIVALAGVIGGKNSSILDTTKNIFIESAVFVPYAVRRTARRFGLDTDSSFQFARGVFPQTTLSALQRACSLIQQTTGGNILNKNYEVGSIRDSKKSILIHKEHLNERLGYDVSMTEFSSWMKKMNSQVKKKSFRYFVVQPPYYRKDLTIKEDLIEEWARLKGYDCVPETLPVLIPQTFLKDKELEFLDHVKHLTKEQGYYQAINYNFVNDRFHNQFLGPNSIEGSPISPSILITNPITQDLNSLRQSLLPGLFKNLLLNIRYGGNWGRLFEQGVSFLKNKEHFEEKQHLAFILWGQKKNIWQDHTIRTPFFDLKSSVEVILNKLFCDSWEWEPVLGEFPFLHPKRRLVLKVQNQVQGFIGVLNPILIEDHKIREDVALGELNLSSLFLLPKAHFHFRLPASLPMVKRDISLLIPHDQDVEGILKLMKEVAPPQCRQISIIDHYEGDQFKKGRRSVSFRLILQDANKTLSDNQINDYQNQIIEALLNKYPVQLR